MKTKRILWQQGHSDIPCAPCPLSGVKVNSYDEFKEMVMKMLFVKEDREKKLGWYPPVVFATTEKGVEIAFAGSFGFNGKVPENPNTGKEYRWAIIRGDEDKDREYFDLEKDFDRIAEMFLDDDTFPGIRTLSFMQEKLSIN